MRNLSYLILLCLLSSLGLNAQWHCIFETPDSAHTILTNNIYKQLRQTRAEKIKINLNVYIVHASSSTAVFFESDVLQLIQNANTYLANINAELQLAPTGIHHLFDDRYNNLKLEQESELRTGRDVTNAINIYFVKNIIAPDNNNLNGYTNFPSKSKNTNRILYSYLDKNNEDFKTLRNKTFLHELGHYFGLLHTFQDSNHSIIEKRELVNRSSDANCSYTGDLLCDTNADPYERLTSLSVYDCSEKIPENLKDALGYRYSPPISNIMSYHIRCGDEFTTQQYQRMTAGLSFRMASNNEYSIVTSAQNTLSLGNIPEGKICAGNTLSLPYSSSLSGGQYTLELSNAYGQNFKPINAEILSDSIRFIIPQNTTFGLAYQLKLIDKLNQIESIPTAPFGIYPKGQISLSSNKTSINAGDNIDIEINMKGGGPYSFTLSDGTQVNNLSQNYFSLSKTLNTSTNYQVVSAKGSCGALTVTNGLVFSVYQPEIEISQNFERQFCEQSYIKMPISGLRNLAQNNYFIKIESSQKDIFFIKPNINLGQLAFYLPKELNLNEVYFISVLGTQLGAFSKAQPFEILPKPSQPLIASPIKVCFNQEPIDLTATGQNLKWYYSDTARLSYEKLTPNTTIPGIQTYFVSQTNNFGCESEKSKIDFNVGMPVSASISGNSRIVKGDTSTIKILLTGEAPWRLVLEDGTTLTSQVPVFEYIVKPANSTTYRIEQVKNNCGSGAISGEAYVEVIQVLSNFTSEKISIYPNPSEDIVTIETDQNSEYQLFLYDQKGRLVWRTKHDVSGITPIKLPATSGVYLLKMWNNKTITEYKIIKR